MIKTTNVQNKEELLSLSKKLGDELTSVKGEIDAIKTKLDAASNYDGLNFEGAAAIIKTNLTNVVSAMETLSTNISGYVTSLNEFDQYEDPLQEDDLVAPELETPDTLVPTTPDEEETKQEETKPEETTPEEKPSEEETTPDEKPIEQTTPVVPPVTETTPPEEEKKPEEDETPSKEEKPEDEEKPQPKPQPQQPKPQPPASQPEPNPEFKPEELDAEEPVVVGKGDTNIDVSKFTNNEELGYLVTTGNTSFELGEKDFDLLCAIIEAESDGTYDGTLSVASALLNRCENEEYNKLYGMDPIAQITGTNQFEGYTTGEFKKYMNNNSDIVVEAVKAALAGVRNHKLCTY